ncbi:MAG: thiol peroxidase [Fusobacteriaceae bacterium]|nr:thiol peroxidase [Fusobacteriaceae bacterium]
MERKNIITFQGTPLTLVGEEIKVGAVSPDFTVTKNNLSQMSLSELKGKVIIISAMPSVDTGICELQTMRFNEEAKNHKDVFVMTISMDLPFALSRFCANKGIENAITVSDYKDREFSHKYGFFIKELALTSRGIVVIDKNGVVKYVQYVNEIATEPNYDKALEVAVSLI